MYRERILASQENAGARSKIVTAEDSLLILVASR